jgi:hypothetical protein
MYVARFRDSKAAIARRKTENAAWKAAEGHEVPLDKLEVVPETRHEREMREEGNRLRGYTEYYNDKSR